jgi:hypothetical protein
MPSEDILRLFLAAAALGSCVGYIFTGLCNNLLELILRALDRRERIEAARTRDHSKVPSIHAQRFDAFQQQVADRFIGPL